MSNNPFTNLSKILLSLNSYEFASLAYLIGLILCDGLNYNEQQSLGNFYNLLGEVMQTIGSQGQNLNDNNSSFNIDNIKSSLKNKIDGLDDIIEGFRKI